METIKIEFQPNIKDKLMEFLNSFKSDEVHIIEEDKDFLETKKILQHRLDELRQGKSELISIEEYEIMLVKEQ